MKKAVLCTMDITEVTLHLTINTERMAKQKM